MFVTVNQLDGSLVGSGMNCTYDYRFKPGIHAMTFIANAIDNRTSTEHYGTIKVESVRLEANGTYLLSSRFDGVALGVDLTEISSGRPVAAASTSSVKTSSMKNAAITALPLLAK